MQRGNGNRSNNSIDASTVFQIVLIEKDSEREREAKETFFLFFFLLNTLSSNLPDDAECQFPIATEEVSIFIYLSMSRTAFALLFLVLPMTVIIHRR